MLPNIRRKIQTKAYRSENHHFMKEKHANTYKFLLPPQHEIKILTVVYCSCIARIIEQTPQYISPPILLCLHGITDFKQFNSKS